MARGKNPTQAELSAVRIQTWVETEGPFFQKDVRKTLYANIGDMLDRVAEFMEQDVRGQMQSHQGEMPYWTGYSAARVKGYRKSARTGKHWALWAAVTSWTADQAKQGAIRTKASASYIEGRWHPYKRTAADVRRARAVVSADITKGLN